MDVIEKKEGIDKRNYLNFSYQSRRQVCCSTINIAAEFSKTRKETTTNSQENSDVEHTLEAWMLLQKGKASTNISISMLATNPEDKSCAFTQAMRT